MVDLRPRETFESTVYIALSGVLAVASFVTLLPMVILSGATMILALAGLIFSIVGIGLMVWAAIRLRDYNDGAIAATVVGAILVLASLYPLWPSFRSFVAARERSALLRDDQLVLARRASAAGREEAQIAMGFAAAAAIVAGILLMAFANVTGDRLNNLLCHNVEVSTTSAMDAVESRAVSFCRLMKSLSSGGMTRRTACGTSTVRSVWV